MRENDRPPEGRPTDGEHGLPQFERLLREHQTPLFSYIHSLVRNLSDADDVFQQVSIILWKKFPKFDPQGSFLAWGCGVARLEVMNFLRVRGRSRLCFSDELTLALIDAQVEVGEDEFEARRMALGGCVNRLRENDQQLLGECYGESGGVVAAAERSGRSTQSIHNSLRRIRHALFECIQRTLAQQSRAEVI